MDFPPKSHPFNARVNRGDTVAGLVADSGRNQKERHRRGVVGNKGCATDGGCSLAMSWDVTGMAKGVKVTVESVESMEKMSDIRGFWIDDHEMIIRFRFFFPMIFLAAPELGRID